MAKSTKSTTQKRSLAASDFYSDYEKEGLLYAVLIRSPAATGRIKSISIKDLPPDYYLFTAEDIPGEKLIEINDAKLKVLGYENIAYTGEPIGILAGPDEHVVYELLDKVTINFDIESLESALKNIIRTKKPVINPVESTDFSNYVNELNALPSLNNVLDKNAIDQVEGKIICQREFSTGKFKELSQEEIDDQLFGKDFKIIEETWTQKLSAPTWKETCGAFCYSEGKKLHIYAPTKWTKNLITTVAKVLDISPEQIVVHKTQTSGVFSKGLWRTSKLASVVALTSWLTKKPVKLVLSQREQDRYMAPGVQTEVKYKTAVTEDGKIHSLIADINIDIGYENPFVKEIVDRMCIAACSFYKPQNVKVTVKAKTSKNPPTSICLKTVDSQIFFAFENHMQLISSSLKLYPDELALANKASKKSRFPIDIPGDSALETINSAIAASDFNRKYISFQMDAINRLREKNNPFFLLPLRGIGIASAFTATEFYGSNYFASPQKVEVTLSASDKLVIHTIKPSEIIENIWKNTAADILQIEKKNISIDSDFSNEEIPDSPEDTFSTISTLNELIKKCCLEIQRKRFHQPLPITSKKVSSATAKKCWNKEGFTGTPFANTSYATTVVEVELDTYTYNERIKGIWMCVDCGEVFDEAAALRTIRLEIQQELAMLVKGKTIPCENITIKFIDSGLKGGQLGELTHNTLPAAFSSALSLALSTQLTSLPCTEKQIFELIKERETLETEEAMENETEEQENEDDK